VVPSPDGLPSAEGADRPTGFEGHEAIHDPQLRPIAKARVMMDVYFEDREPVLDVKLARSLRAG